MIIIKQLAPEFKIELSPEYGYPVAYVLRLKPYVFCVIKPDFSHSYISALYYNIFLLYNIRQFSASVLTYDF